MTQAPLLLGGRYEIGELLGRGGMAEVHVGRDTRLGRTVAVKMLRTDLARDQSVHARFRREAQSAASLNHPSVVAVYDSGEDASASESGPVPYIVMERVEGRTLREVVGKGRPMPWREALRVTSGVLAALAYSHRAGIVHRDIKPANVMVTPGGDVKVMDFGIARAVSDASATMTQTQAVIGTAQYLSPEQARGETVDARSDIYSAGCLLFELITGRPPFVGDSPVSVAYQHVGEPPPAPSTLNPDLPASVDAVVLHALQKDRADRYQNADDFRDDVQAALGGRRVSDSAVGSIPPIAAAAAEAGGAATVAVTTLAVAQTPAVPATTALTTQAPPVVAALPESVLRYTDDVGQPPARKGRGGLWVLLALVTAALVAVALLVLPNLLGGRDDSPRSVAVPVLTTLTLDEAKTRLADAGLTFGTSVERADDTVDEGLVSSQDPAAGTQLERGKPVSLVVSSGPDTVSVPDLSGRTKDEAAAALKAAGLELGKVTEVQDPTAAKGDVVSSDPPSGDPVAPGSAVAVEVADGTVQVPNVIGLALPEAIARLTDVGLKADAAHYLDSNEFPRNTVLKQSNNGKTVDQGATIVLYLAQMPTDTPTQTPTSPTGSPTTGTPTGTTSPSLSLRQLRQRHGRGNQQVTQQQMTAWTNRMLQHWLHEQRARREQ